MAYNLDITKTAVLLAAYEQKKKPTTFLKSRYFPDGVNFGTDEVLVEYKEGNQKIAPFVAPEVGGKVVKRNGYSMKSFQPAFIAPKRALSVDTLKKKGFGEAYYNQLTPEERALAITADDLAEMDEMIVIREEAMCAEVLQTNALTMNHYSDDNKLIEVKNIAYFEGDTNPAVYAPAKSWASADADIIGDCAAIALSMKQRGLAATDVILGTEAADALLNNEKIQKLLDNRNYNIGTIDPTEQFDDAVLLAQLNCKGHKLNFIQYTGTYQAEDGKVKDYINAKDIIITAPGCGQTNYGAITQIDYGSSDFTTHVAKRVPLYEVDKQVKSVALRTAPLVQPINKDPYIKATVIFEG